MTRKKILFLTLLLVAGLLTVVWGARAPKKPPTAAREADHQHDHQTMTTKSMATARPKSLQARRRTHTSTAGTMTTTMRKGRWSA